jgi:hypothetical protein
VTAPFSLALITIYPIELCKFVAVELEIKKKSIYSLPPYLQDGNAFTYLHRS